MKHVFKPRGLVASIVVVAGLSAGAMLITGCTVYTNSPPPPPAPEPVVTGPVVEGPGVVVVTEVPPPDERVYVYDPGFPPGTYYIAGDPGFYYYDGYRYPHDVFYNQYVVVNVRERRFIDVNENRRVGAGFVARDRVDYSHRGGHPVGPARPEPRRDERRP